MDIKSFGQLMDDLGFKKESSFETKKAFLKHLFEQATISELNNKSVKKEPGKYEQLSLLKYLDDKSA